jgi:hypothetical protein
MRAEIRKRVSAIQRLRAEREHINHCIRAELDALEAIGVSRGAVKDALRRLGMTEAQRDEHDIGYALTLSAFGLCDMVVIQ